MRIGAQIRWVNVLRAGELFGENSARVWQVQLQKYGYFVLDEQPSGL
jgi:hypothetical protein